MLSFAPFAAAGGHCDRLSISFLSYVIRLSLFLSIALIWLSKLAMSPVACEDRGQGRQGSLRLPSFAEVFSKAFSSSAANSSHTCQQKSEKWVQNGARIDENLCFGGPWAISGFMCATRGVDGMPSLEKVTISGAPWGLKGVSKSDLFCVFSEEVWLCGVS